MSANVNLTQLDQNDLPRILLNSGVELGAEYHKYALAPNNYNKISSKLPVCKEKGIKVQDFTQRLLKIARASGGQYYLQVSFDYQRLSALARYTLTPPNNHDLPTPVT